MKKSEIFVYSILCLFVIVCTHRIVDVCILEREHFQREFDNLKNMTITGSSAPRGRILDVNGKVLVDNTGINTLIYNRTDRTLSMSEVDIAYKLGDVLKFDESRFTTGKLKTFYMIKNGGCKNLITEEEYQLYKERKLSGSDLEALKYERITDEVLSEFSFEDKNAAFIYSILSTGYYYEDKIIKKNLSDEEVVAINDLDLPGIRTDLTWERIYPYGDTLRSVLGTISTNGVPLEMKDYFLDKGVSLNSTVGTSFLELEYDDYLRGKDAKYKIGEDGRLELIEPEEMGADVYLSIDIDKQLEIERILKSEILNAKKLQSAKYFNHSFLMVGDPNTGEIVAAAGLQLVGDKFKDITATMISSSYTVGSIVKGATMSVGYANNLIQEGKTVTDSCIKVYGVAQKCSWTRLGAIDDIRAMAQSSNYYQFLIATRLTNPNYRWNSKLGATQEHFDIYRDMLSSYGLGAITGVDLPNERTGIKGRTVSDDLLLNLAIGQYDTYTPIEVFQYVNTLANDGTRLKPTFMKKIVKNDETILEQTPTVVGKVALPIEKIERVQKGLREVMISGTGRNYASSSIQAAGKTGTSETFIDTDGDGKIDTNTTSTAFILYAPYDDPKYSLMILSPNISAGGHKYAINLRVIKQVSDYLFSSSMLVER